MSVRRHEQGQDYHMVLLDWEMPGMNGLETARELRRHLGEDVPILLISAYDWSEIEKEARLAGITGFISKPLFKSTLFYELKRFVEEDAEPGGGQYRRRLCLRGTKAVRILMPWGCRYCRIPSGGRGPCRIVPCGKPSPPLHLPYRKTWDRTGTECPPIKKWVTTYFRNPFIYLVDPLGLEPRTDRL